jgi:hypothetical protein
MNRHSTRRSALPALLVAAGFGALHGVSGCGQADSSRVDSEPTWLMSCSSDLDCDIGGCECGVCTETCSSSADCSVLGVSGVECAAVPDVCGSAAGSSCRLPCAVDADCSALGAGAVCWGQRCELRASSASSQALCDGSDDIRFLYVRGASDGLLWHTPFTASRDGGFLAIDGQCRFWTANSAHERVTSGTLSSEDAAFFATRVGYDRFAELPPYDDQVPALGVGLSRIWSPASHASCVAGCAEGSDAEGWFRVVAALEDSRVREPFANGQPVSGPLRLVLVGYRGDASQLRTLDRFPQPWPLSRPPSEDELSYAVDFEPPPLDESSGVDITDPGELSALRAARDAFLEIEAGAGYTPLDWIDPATQQELYLHMLLRDELPAPVQAALDRPLF